MSTTELASEQHVTKPTVQQHRWSPWPARVWPVVRHARAPRRALIGAMCAGVVATFALGDPGIGYLVTASAMVIAVAVVRPKVWTTWKVAGALAVLASSSVAVFRSAEWLVTLSVWSAVLVAGVVLSESWTWRGSLLGALTPAVLPVRTLRWLSLSVRGLDTGRIRPVRIALVVAVTAILTFVFATLFAAADPAFEAIVDAATPQWDLGATLGRAAVFVLVAGGASAASYLTVVRPHFDRVAKPTKSTVSPWEWIVPVSAVVVLFAAFVFVQITALFGGQRYVVMTDGLTNAEYARQGFWQLLAVTALTLMVIAIVIRKASRQSAADRTILRGLLGVLCALALVVVASALHRMSLYEQQYGFTTLRLAVTAVELFLGSVFVMIMATGVSMSGRWLPRAVGAAAVLTVLGLAVANPDAYIARHNIERFESTGKLDIEYLSGLSSDAAPELDRLPEPYRSCVMRTAKASHGWRGWNLADSRAERLPETRPSATCASRP